VRTIPELVRAAVDDAGSKPWLFSHDTELTYAEMLARVERAASGLRALGVGRGDRVLVTPRNTPEYLLSWFALMEAGAIQVPINPKSSEAEIAGFVHQVDPALVVTDQDKWPAAPRLELSGTGYYRLRRDYEQAELERWRRELRSECDSREELHVYFRHEPQAPAWAARMLEL